MCPRRPRYLGIRWLRLQPPEQVTSKKFATLEQVLAADTKLAVGDQVQQRFRSVMQARDAAALRRRGTPGVGDAQRSTLVSFASLANGILADRSTVAALRSPWSTGPVEGHILRLKLIKQHGYGRARPTPPADAGSVTGFATRSPASPALRRHHSRCGSAGFWRLRTRACMSQPFRPR